VVNAGTLQLYNGSINLKGSARLASQPGTTLSLPGNLLGTTTNADQFAPQGTVLFNASGTATSPQQLEVMGQDLGNTAAGFINNFAYGTLALQGTYVKLVDNARNSPGTNPEALYVNTLIVQGTLNLNSLHVYARVAQVNGTVIGGTINQVPAGGPISFGSPASGSIATASQVDDWTFFGRAGQAVTVSVSTGSSSSPVPPQPGLNFAQVALLDPSGNVVATTSNMQSGANATLGGIGLAVDGTYHIRVQAPAAHAGSTGFYLLSLQDATGHQAPLNFNETVTKQVRRSLFALRAFLVPFP
jgi:hypothetical protein